MGHSVKQWDVAYNPTLMLQRCEQAVMGMEAWRANMLASMPCSHAGPSIPAASPVQVSAQPLSAFPAVTAAGTARPTVLTAEDIPAPVPPLASGMHGMGTAGIQQPAAEASIPAQQLHAPAQGQQPEVPHRPLSTTWSGASPLLSMMPGFSVPAPALPQSQACQEHASPLLSMLDSEAREWGQDEDDEIFIDIIDSDEL